MSDQAAPSAVRDFGQATSYQLLASARAGDDAAVDALYRRYYKPLRRFTHGRIPDWAREGMDTDDLVQESLMRSLDKLESFEFRGRGGFQSYLRRIVLNRLRDHLRRLAARSDRPRPAHEITGGLEDPAPSPIRRVMGLEALRRYEEAFERLRPQEQEVIIARVELGFSYRDVALATDRPSADAARMAVTRALRRLAEDMARHE